MFALLAPLTLVAPQGLDHSTLHPASPLVYFEMADVQGIYQAYQGTAYAQIMADPACRRAVEKLTRQKEGALDEPAVVIHSALDEFTDGAWGLIQPSLAQIQSISGSISLEGMSEKELLAGMDTSGFWTRKLEERLNKHLRMQLIVDFANPAIAGEAFSNLRSLADEPAAQVTVGTIGVEDATELHIDVSDFWDIPMGIAQTGTRLYVVFGTDPIAYADRRLKKPGPSSRSRFDVGHKRFKNPQGITVFEFQSRIAEAFYGACPEKEYIQPVMDLVAAGMGPDFDMLLRGGQWRIQLMDSPEGEEPGKLFITEGFQRDLNLGKFDRLFSNHGIQTEALDYIHPESVVASAGTMDQQLLVELLKHAFQDTGEDPFKELETKYAFRPEEDVLQHLGTTWVSSLPLSSIGAVNLPGVALWVDLNDKEGFIQGMEKLQQVVAGEAPTEVELRSKVYRKHTLFTLRAVDPSDTMEAIMQPTVVVFDDKVLVTVSRSHAQKEIKRAVKAPMDREAHAHVNADSMPKGLMVVDMSYADWAKVFGRIYTGAQSFLPIFRNAIPKEEVDKVPVDLDALPDSSLFTRFFQPTFRHRHRVEGGILTHCRSSVGPELSGIISLGMLAGVFWFGEEMGGSEAVLTPVDTANPPPPPVEPVDPPKKKPGQDD